MNSSPYIPMPARLEKVVQETPNIKTFFVRPERPLPFKAGQFIELSVPGMGEAPFTPSSSPAVSDLIEVTIMRAGRVTDKLHSLEAGAELAIRGPLGKPYPLENFRGREVLIVGGGVGLAPLRALLFALFEDFQQYKKIMIRYGAKTPADLVYRGALQEHWGRNDLDLLVTVDRADPGWDGLVGVVTTILAPNRLSCNPADGVAVICGPPIMMKFTALELLTLGYAPENIYLSMEKNMSCGIGKCGHCRLGTFYACVDGPVFTYASVQHLHKIWD